MTIITLLTNNILTLPPGFVRPDRLSLCMQKKILCNGDVRRSLQGPFFVYAVNGVHQSAPQLVIDVPAEEGSSNRGL